MQVLYLCWYCSLPGFVSRLVPLMSPGATRLLPLAEETVHICYRCIRGGKSKLCLFDSWDGGVQCPCGLLAIVAEGCFGGGVARGPPAPFFLSAFPTKYHCLAPFVSYTDVGLSAA